MDSDKKRILKLVAVLVGTVVLALGISLLLPFLEKKVELPQVIKDARLEAGPISAEVVRLSNEANERIKALGALKYPEEEANAVGLLTEAEYKNTEAYEKSVALSEELKRMAEALPEVKPETARRMLEEAITVEISLITEFIQYSKELNMFLGHVNALLVNPTEENRDRVKSAEISLNARVEAINRLNEEFLRRMEELDKITK